MEDVSSSKNPKQTNTKKHKEDMMPKTPFFSKMRQITNTNVNTVDMMQLKVDELVDVSASKNSKGTNTKKDKEDMMHKTTFFSKMRRITDTYVDTVDMLQIKDRLKEGQSPLAKEIQKAVVHHSLGVDTSITTMMSNIRAALDFEDIREEDINEAKLGSRLDELGKVAIKKKHLNTLSSLNAFIGFAKEYEKDHKKTLQTKNSVMKSAELKIKHTPCPPIEKVS